MRVALIVGLLAGCTLPVTGLTQDAGGDNQGTDASVLEAGTFDAAGRDAGPRSDAGPRRDADAPNDAGPPAADGGCPAASCEADVLRTCAPDGTPQVEMCALGCSAVATRCATLVPSNVDRALFVGGTDLVLDVDVDTTTCALGMRVAQTGGGDACLIRGRDVTVPSGATVTVSGDVGLIVLATRNALVSGTIDVSARGEASGPGGEIGGDNGMANGAGPRGGAGGSQSSFSEAGGGGGGHCGRGGRGGVGGTEAGGAGGGALGAGFTLSPLRGGSGGGRGGADPAVIGRGGAGGGALQISAGISLRLDGRILAGGGGGDGAGSLGCGVNAGAGGGGGAGGAVLLESPQVTYGGGASITTSGGGGGGSSNGCRNSDDGGSDGDDGADTLGPAAGGLGNGSFSNEGGEGGGGNDPNAGNGLGRTLDGGNGGGGGGGAGCVLVRQSSASRPSGGAISADDPSSYRAITVAID